MARKFYTLKELAVLPTRLEFCGRMLKLQHAKSRVWLIRQTDCYTGEVSYKAFHQRWDKEINQWVRNYEYTPR